MKIHEWERKTYTQGRELDYGKDEIEEITPRLWPRSDDITDTFEGCYVILKNGERVNICEPASEARRAFGLIEKAPGSKGPVHMFIPNPGDRA